MKPLNLDPNTSYLTTYQPIIEIPEWRKSLGSFAKETSALGSGLLALGAQTVGADETRDKALADYQQSMEEAQSGWRAPAVGQIEDIKLTDPGGLGRLGNYLEYQVPKGIAQLGSLVVSGLGAGTIAKATASAGIKALAKEAVKNMAEKRVVSALGQDAVKQLAKRQAVGMAAGTLAGGFGMETGQTYGQFANDPNIGPEKAVGPSLAYGGIASLLEYLPIHAGARAIGLDRMLLRKVIKESPELAQQAVELSLKKKALKAAGKVAGTGLLGGAAEGITEGLQALAQNAAERYAKEDPTWMDIIPRTPEEWSNVWNQAAAAAATGLVAGAALGPFTGQQPTTRGNVSGQEAEAASATRGGLPPNAQQQESQAPTEATAATPSSTTTEVIPNVVPRGEETSAGIPGETAVPSGSSEALAATAEQPTGESIGRTISVVQQPDEGWSVVGPDGLIARDVESEQEANLIRDRAVRGDTVKTTASPQAVPPIVETSNEVPAGEVAAVAPATDVVSPQRGQQQDEQRVEEAAQTPIVSQEVPNAEQVPSAGEVYADVSRSEQQGGQEVQMPTEEGGDRVLQGGQEEVREVIKKADGSVFATKASATKKLNQLWERGELTIQEGPEAGKQARARVAKQGDGYVIERLESQITPAIPAQATTNFVAATDSLLGQGWTQRAIDAGILQVHETSPADSASGYYDPTTGKFVVNLDRIPKGQSPVGTLLHETSHASMARMLGDQFQGFHSDLQKLADRGSETARLAVLQATQGAITAINRQRELLGLETFPHRLGDETLPAPERANEVRRVRQLIDEQNPGLLPEEDLAYYIQLASTSHLVEVGFWRRLLAAIQAWVAQTNFGKAMAGIGWRPELSPQLAVELAKQAAQATLRRAELVNQLVGEQAKVLRGLPASAQLGVMESSLGRQEPSANWWRSGVLDTISSASQQKATPDQWLGWLKNQAGVKQEEIDDFGLEDWLAAQEGTVMKAEVEKFVRDGGVRIEEVVKGAMSPTDLQELIRLDQMVAHHEALSPEQVARYNALTEQEAFEKTGKQATKFSRYQTPGGENYRELLITVPPGDTRTREEQEFRELDRRMATDGLLPDESRRWEELGQRLGPVGRNRQNETPQYRSSHWSEPNVLVHIRFNERQDAEGKRVLFVEEVQSDWHQEGRKRGYKQQGELYPQLSLTQKRTVDSWLQDLNAGESSPRVIAEKPLGQYTPEDAVIDLGFDMNSLEGVPNAPLKSAWPLLGMKRAIRWAAEHGFDKVAWTPGEVQAERYDLSKQVSRVYLSDPVWYGENDIRGALSVTDLSGQDILQKQVKSRSEIADYIGKEATEKLVDSPTRMEGRTHVLQGDGLKVGGEGMRGFYDKMLPSMLNKYTKRFGAKVQTTSINTPNSWQLEPVYEWLFEKSKLLSSNLGSRFRDQLLGWRANRDQGLESLKSRVDFYVLDKRENEQLHELINSAPDSLRGPITQEVWSLPITPALRDEAFSGQLLYSIPPTNSWPEMSTWFTSPVSTYPEDFNKPGEFNKVAHALVDRFHYVQEKSPGLYRAFDEWKNRQGALQKEVERIYEVPLRNLVSRYRPGEKDFEPIQKMQDMSGLAETEKHVAAIEKDFADGKITQKEYEELIEPLKNTKIKSQSISKVELLGHQLAARHILLDNVTEQLALRAAPEFLQELKKQLTPKAVEDLNKAIKGLTDGSISIKKLSNEQARKLFEEFLSGAEKDSDIAERWALYNRRSAGYSIATPGTDEAAVDARAGFINAHELVAPDGHQIVNRELFQQITALTDQLAAHQLKMLQEGGLLTQAEVDNLSRAYPHFVPLRREAFDYGLELKEIFEKPRQSIGKLMAREGSTETPSAVHVLQNHLASGFMAASAAARNQMMNKFYDVVNADRTGWKPWFYPSSKRKNNGAMGLIRDGETIYIVPTDGNLRAASIAKVIVGQDAQELSGPLKLMRTINNWIRWSNVSASPAFLLANAPRDYLTSRYNLLATDAAEYAKEIGSWSSYKESFKALHKVLVQGVRESADPQEQAWIDLVEDFEKAGGKTSFVEALRAMDGDSWKSFEAQVGRREGKQRSVVEWGRGKLEWIENLNEAFENVMRLSTYKVMRDKVGKERAAEIARNLTTNFTRRGAHIDTINTWWLFYNATVQGNWQVIQNMFLNPNKAGQRRLQKAVARTIMFSFLVDQLGRALSDDEDKDGISDWDARTSGDKERKISLPFKVGGVYPSIPAPWVFNVFWRLGGMLGEVKDGVLKPQDAVLDSIGLTLTTMNPVSGGTPAQFISPSAFDPFMQIIENKDFMGNPLGPDGYPGASKRPDAYLAWDSTPKGFKHVAQFMNEVTGGSPVESGKIDLRPSSLKVLTDFALGGLGRSVVELGQLGLAPITDEIDFKGPEKVPGLKVFLSAPSDSTAISLYHDRVAQVLGAKRLEKLYGDENNYQKLAEVRQSRAAVLRMVPQVEDTERQIKALRKTLRSAQARNDSRTEEQLRERIVQLQKRFNQSFSRRIGN